MVGGLSGAAMAWAFSIVLASTRYAVTPGAAAEFDLEAGIDRAPHPAIGHSASRSETARSLRIIAAIDGDRAAGHPARLVRSEKQYGANKVLRLAEAAERDLSNRCAPPLGVGVAGAG
jgi:hypothetical protein